MRELTSVPTATYRLQLTADFTLHDAAALVGHLADLGVSHVYCSPWLQAAAGSTHGYDVVDHTRVDAARGGDDGVRALAEACRGAGLGIVLDLVPNHMSVAAPEDANPAWTAALRGGHREWFDLQDGPIRLPIRGDDGAIGPEHVLPEGDGWVAVPWREGPSYRRFFDVDTLAGLRVEDPAVFDATHAVIVEQVRSGLVEGLRIDHPDGLADPGGYLERLAAAVPGTWTVVEKILEHGEDLPDWPCEGTTGYDALLEVTQLFTDPAGRTPLEDLVVELTGQRPDWDAECARGKQQVLAELFTPELDRLVSLGGDRSLLIEKILRSKTYRTYDATDELGVRTEQLTGPVMAKGVEDTACYRHLTLLAHNEVGGDPGRFGSTLEEWHAWCLHAQQEHPLSMTTASTHDTKRSADVRSRLLLLSEEPGRWAPLARSLTALGTERGLDAATSYFAAQTLLGAWPLPPERLAAYLTKATKEAKLLTGWREPDASYDALVVDLARRLPALAAPLIEPWLAGHAEADELAVLSSTLVSLWMPGVPDVYQGCELVDRSLVDPDNRRGIDPARLRSSTEPKTALVRTALRLRRDRPDAARGSYEPLDLEDDRFVGFVRGGSVAVVAPRRPLACAGLSAPPVPGFSDLLGHPTLRLAVR
jgi:(1->4)-alpha-D-glucan 1-alpha-D-glucosylmutase